ncbi:hypothetical protein [Methylobacterium sp. E-066]|uniref:AbiU2 domain-containing protein n=1 Tax=Methylobacterium sp. E-066 TaxID=2836584 RepID=UPI001FBA6875|nr:hypothetical protein [Methylobacterium sp. E-066]MCJ2143707.1 hypothetical protein [Methylobacterium sp. E-066]
MSTVVEELKGQVRAAGNEFDTVMQFHEVWRPAAFDADLRARMLPSFAGHAYHLIRIALRREVYLGLMRLWGSRKDELRLEEIGRQLRTPKVFDALVADRIKTWPFGDEDGLRRSLQVHVDKAFEIIDRYSKGGAGEPTLAYLRKLRHEHLAHRAKNPVQPEAPDQIDADVEALYGDMATLVSELFHAVLATAYNPRDTADGFKYYAELFWEAARGERTEGHPRYRPPPTSP